MQTAARAVPRSPLIGALAVRPFRWFWIAAMVSLLGDQLILITLPWLVLQLTGDPGAVGSVLALAAIPRALFMLIGGAVTDRWSPRIVLLGSVGGRLVLVAGLAYATGSGTVTMPLVYALALLFGLVDAFSFPAQAAMPPRLLDHTRLPGGNALIQGAMQLSLVIGPALAGLLIAFATTDAAGGAAFEDQAGMTLVFTLAALTFLAPVIVLSLIRDRPGGEAAPPAAILGALLEGLRHTWRDPGLRWFIALLSALSLVFRGPFMVGVPAFAEAYLAQGAAGFGTLVSAIGVGAIIGSLLAGFTRWPPDRRLGVLLTVDFMGFGCVFLAMLITESVWILAGAICATAVVDGLLTIRIITWIQQRVPGALLGRVMSVLMFFNLGLVPLSSALAGAAAELDLRLMLGGAGLLLVLVAAGGMALPAVRRLS